VGAWFPHETSRSTSPARGVVRREEIHQSRSL